MFNCTVKTVEFRTHSYQQQIHHGKLCKIIFEIPSSVQMRTVCFHAQMVLPFLFRVLYCMYRANLLLLCYPWTLTRLIQLRMDLKPVIYGRLASIFAIGRISLKKLITSCQKQPCYYYKADQTQALGIYLCRAGLPLFVYIQY